MEKDGNKKYPSGFFRILWNINAVLIAVLMLLTIGWQAIPQIMKDMREGRQVYPQYDQSVVKVRQQKKVVEEKMRTDSFRHYYGTSLMSANVRSVDAKEGVRNMLFFDSKTGISRRLFKTNDQLIMVISELRAEEIDLHNRANPIRVLVYRVVEKDSNGDGRLDLEDENVIAISRADGSGYRVIAKADTSEEVDRGMPSGMIINDQGVYLNRYQGEITAYYFDAETLEAIKTVELE